MALRKVCTELEIKFGWSKNAANAVLAEEGIKNPSSDHLKEELDWVEEEHHAIIFLYKADKQRYGKLIEEMENDMLQKKDPFLKTVSGICWVLSGLKNKRRKWWNCLCDNGASGKKG